MKTAGAEGSFKAGLSRLDVSLQHDFCVRRHLHVNGLTLDHLYGMISQKSCQHHLVYVRGHGCGGGVGDGRVTAQGGGYLCPFTLFPIHAIVPCAVVVHVPVHARCLLVVDLEPVHACVSGARFWILGEDRREGDELASVLGPTLYYGKFVERGVIRYHHLLAVCMAYHFRWEIGEFH